MYFVALISNTTFCHFGSVIYHLSYDFNQMFSYFLQEPVIQEENNWVFELMTIIVFQVADVLIYDHVMLYCCWYITELITVMLISTVIPGLVEHRLMYCLSSFTVGKLFDKKNRIQAFFDFQSQTDQGDG